MHKEKIIIFIDHSNLAGAEYVRAVEESAKMARESDTANRLILIDATNSIVDKNVLKALKKLTSTSSSRISKIAVIGLTGIQLFFMRAVSSFSKTNIKPFDTRENALNWLTS